MSEPARKHIWIVTVGEPLPIDDGAPRLFRAGILAETLADRGHSVVWWTSSFDHWKKMHRVASDHRVQIRENLELVLLRSFGYRKNVSLARLADHWGVARKFANFARNEKEPDVIFCSMPTIELSVAATDYGRKRNIPVILDIRDLWPEIFPRALPAWLRPPARLALWPLFRALRRACTDATAICGATGPFVGWGVQFSGRKRSQDDRDFPLSGKLHSTYTEEETSAADLFWEKKGLRKGDFVVCFYGTFGQQFDMETVFAAAEKLQANRPDICFVLCGAGDRFDEYQERCRESENVILPGWVDGAHLASLSRVASVGLTPYWSTDDFIIHLPNKAIEYLSAGLPVVSSLSGLLRELLADGGCGLTYDNGDASGLATILSDLSDQRDRLSEMATNARAVYAKGFQSEKVYGDMADYLEEMAHREPTP